MGLNNEYPYLISSTNVLLMPFENMYLCETSFSDWTVNKTKHRAKLTLKTDLQSIPLQQC